MSLEQVTEHVFRIPQEDTSLFLIVLEEALTLVDAGFPGSWVVVRDALAQLGRRPEEIRDILVTHCHPDHAGGLAEIKKGTGGRVWMHPADAEMVRAGRCYRPWTPAPGAHNEAFAREFIVSSPQTADPVEVEGEATPGGRIPVAGGIEVVATPGHTLGHAVFLWPQDGRVLFLGDAAKNVEGLEPATIYEDFPTGIESLRSLAAFDFEVACFAHGAPLVGGADEEFRKVWGAA